VEDNDGLRRLRDDDAEAVAVLFNDAFGDWRPLDAEEIRSWLRNEELNPEYLRVLEADGRVVGYGDLDVHDDEVALDVAAPGHWEVFLDWAEETARTLCRPRVRTYFPARHELATVVERRGYRLWRSAHTMEMRLDELQPVVMPEGLRLLRYRPDVDEDRLRTAINEVFADDPLFHVLTEARFREFYLRARGFDPSLWLLAWAGDELAGFTLVFPERQGDRELGWIGNLGVRQAWRRRGLGEALLRASFHELQQRGMRKVGLGVDADNASGALRLYESVGMRQITQGDNWVLDLSDVSAHWRE